MSQEYEDQGVVFLGVAVSDREEDARGFAEKVGVNYPIGLAPLGTLQRPTTW